MTIYPLPSCDTATECMMLCEKSFRPFSKRSEGMSRFTAMLAYTRSFCEFVGVWTVNIFSSVNHVMANLALRLVVETDVCRMEHLLTGMLILVLVLFLKDSLRTFFKSLSWSLGSGPCPCPGPWGSGPCPCPGPCESGPCSCPGPCGLVRVLVLVFSPCKDLFPLFHY